MEARVATVWGFTAIDILNITNLYEKKKRKSERKGKKDKESKRKMKGMKERERRGKGGKIRRTRERGKG